MPVSWTAANDRKLLLLMLKVSDCKVSYAGKRRFLILSNLKRGPKIVGARPTYSKGHYSARWNSQKACS